MTRDPIGRATVRTAVQLACRAPSVHNTQPWLWLYDATALHLYADRSRQLPGTDPDGRELVLSCGAALHHVRVALADLDVTTLVHHLPDADDDHLAELGLHPGRPVMGYGSARAIMRRHTDRRPFTDWPVPSELVHELEAAAAEQGATLRAVEDDAFRLELLDAIGRADQLAAADPVESAEARLWSGVFAGSDGVPASALLHEPAAGIAAGRFGEGTLEQAAIPDAAQLFVIGTSSDDTLSHLRAGEATSAVLLHATERGLGSSALSRVLEYQQTRTLVADRVLDGALCPQLVLRIGWPLAGAEPLPATPRRPLDEVLVERTS